MTRGKLTEIFRNPRHGPTRYRTMAEIMEMKILELRFLLGSVESLPQRILADRFAGAREDEVSAVKARELLSLPVELVQDFGERRTDRNLLSRLRFVPCRPRALKRPPPVFSGESHPTLMSAGRSGLNKPRMRRL